MEINTTGKHLKEDPAAESLLEFLRDNEADLLLSDARFYYDFPLFKDEDGAVVVTRALLVSSRHGVIAVATSNSTTAVELEEEASSLGANLENVYTFLFSRLIRNPNLKSRRTQLRFPITAFIYAPFLRDVAAEGIADFPLVITYRQVEGALSGVGPSDLPEAVLLDLVSTIEGAKGIIRPKPRQPPLRDPRSKGVVAAKAEAQIAVFDHNQKHGYMSVLDGLQRIRGLAGSGKTIVLAMKAALMHLRYPDAAILYTFYTRSLYQYIQRLITRFYRQFDDKDPDWSKLRILHAWGGYSSEGVYFNACKNHGVEPVRFGEASRRSPRTDPFDFVCKTLMEQVRIQPMYDYVLVDEGQDFPNSFLRLCVKLGRDSRVVYAYDELQTIFQTTAPLPSDILGPGAQLSDDFVLYRCYRNPGEILVTAHALGFGLYGPKPVQMLENRDHWEDIGYRVLEGEFKEGSAVRIERPFENSPSLVSKSQERHEIVRGTVYDTYADEIQGTATSIQRDIAEGLRPDDILVVVVDDRNAKAYLNHVAEALAALGISTNNIHADSFSVRDFYREGRVTLSTVHKAKGNEGFMVYVIGVDALFSSYAGVRERNMLFTAMTRAKGWVRVSGIGPPAANCVAELNTALETYPLLRFTFPSEEQLKIMRRDLQEKAAGKQKAERMLDQVLAEMSPEEIRRFVEQRSVKKG